MVIVDGGDDVGGADGDRFIAEHDLQPGLFDDGREALRRRRGIDRHKGRTREEHAADRFDAAHRIEAANADEAAGADAVCLQRQRNGAGTIEQLPTGDHDVAAHERIAHEHECWCIGGGEVFGDSAAEVAADDGGGLGGSWCVAGAGGDVDRATTTQAMPGHRRALESVFQHRDQALGETAREAFVKEVGIDFEHEPR